MLGGPRRSLATKPVWPQRGMRSLARAHSCSAGRERMLQRRSSWQGALIQSGFRFNQFEPAFERRIPSNLLQLDVIVDGRALDRISNVVTLRRKVGVVGVGRIGKLL